MKKRFILLTLLVLLLCGCTSKSANEFKKEYEALNGKTNASGKVHRTITIDKNNPFEKVTAEEIVKKFENKETFYVYFGDELCPWCRSVIEKFIENANKNKIEKVYYVKIWDSEGTEVVRDKYQIDENGDLTEVVPASETYKKLLEYFDNVLSDYNIKDKDGNDVYCNEKRIFAPNFMYVENGVTIKKVDGISQYQTDSRGDLTKEILEEEDRIFEEFFAK